MEEWQPFSYLPRNKSGAEARYSAIEREWGAVMFALVRWAYYLLGEHFELITDHIAL